MKKIILSSFIIVFIAFGYACEKGEDTEVQKTEEIKIENLTGTWNLTSSDGDSGPLQLRQIGKDLIGTFKGTNNPGIRIAASGTISGDNITLELSVPGSDGIIEKYSGKVVGDKMSGKWVYDDHSGTWEANKQ
jgi:hypothetical protein